MKKKWTYLAVAGMLLGTAPVFTGCVDNDEPAGIEQLRGAKAQLLQAKAAVEEAKALVKQAQAEYKQAEAQRMRAWAAQAEYEAELKRLEVERAEAATEYEKVFYQEKIQDLQEKMEISAIQHQQEMLQNQYNLEYTKRQIELLMERLEIADAIGSEEVSVSISYLEQQVKKAYCVLYGGQWGTDTTQSIDEDEALYNIMVKAQEAVYNAMLNHSHGIITDLSGDKSYIAQLEYEVAKEQARLDAEKKALEKVQNFLEEDVLTADWRAQIASLEDEIAEVKKNWDAAWVAQETTQNSGSYLEAKQKLYGIYSKDKPMGSLSTPTNIQVEGIVCDYPTASNALEAVQDGAYQTYIKAKREVKKQKKDEANIFTLAEGELTKGISAGLNTVLNQAETDVYGTSTLTWTNGIAYDEMSYRYYDKTTDKVLGKVNVEEGEYPVTVDENGDEVTSGWTVAMLFQTIQKMELIIAEAEENKLITTALETEFGALKTNLATAKTTLNAAFEKAYTDAFGTAEKALTDAETALLTADAAMAAEEAKITDLKVEVAKWKDTYDAYTAIKDALVQAVNNNLTLGGNVKFDNTEGFELALSKEELRCQKAVSKTEQLLADAQVELEKAQDGQYDDLTRAQHKLEVANYNYNQGLTDYQDALDDLNTALAAIADEEEGGNAEQPGDGNEDPAGEEEQPAE